METTELKAILENHKKWLNNEDDGKRADLSVADLSEANLSEANLSWADLLEANLSWANLSWADLSGANLSGANLDFLKARLHCGFGFAKTDKKQRQQLLAHAFSFFTNSELDSEEQALLELARKYVKGWHREGEFGKI